MEDLDELAAASMPEINIQPKVFVRKLGGSFVEVAGITKFERDDETGSSPIISFEMATKQDEEVKAILADEQNAYVDVKMEFLMGMLMIMTFSGFINEVGSNFISISVSTEIATDVEDTGEMLH